MANRAGRWIDHLDARDSDHARQSLATLVEITVDMTTNTESVEHYDSANCDCVPRHEFDVLRAENERLRAALIVLLKYFRERLENDARGDWEGLALEAELALVRE